MDQQDKKIKFRGQTYNAQYITTSTKNKQDEIISQLNRKGLKFYVETYGTTSKVFIPYSGNAIIFLYRAKKKLRKERLIKAIQKNKPIDYFYGNGFVKGSYLIPMFNKAVDKYIDNGNVVLSKNYDPTKNRPKEQMYNAEQIAAAYNNNSNIKVYDINHCYWRSAYNLGIINEKVYVHGLKDEHYKLSRNMAIGSLIKQTKIHEYNNGYLNKKYVSQQENRKQYINELIKREVENLMYDMMKVSGAAIWYVDALYINTSDIQYQQQLKENKNFIEDIFKKRGYSIKSENVKIVGFGRYSFQMQKKNNKIISITPSFDEYNSIALHLDD